MQRTELYWLPAARSWAEAMAAPCPAGADAAWQSLVALANFRLGSLETMRLDRRRARALPSPPSGLATKPIRLAVLGSSMVDHLLPAIRVAGLRRGIWVETFTPDYGQYAQDLMNPASPLHRFRPDTVLFALDAPHLLQGLEPGMAADAWLERRVATLAGYWQTARQAFGCQVIQNIPLPVFVPMLGGNEHRLPGSRVTALRRLSAMLRERSDAADVDIVSLDDRAATDGLAAWHDPALWHRAKHEIHPDAAPLYGDLVGRLIAAAQGRSSKCLVLDLDNTLWGGVIGDDGLEGLKLGQGSAAGEAFAAFQHYVRDLGRRGVILAVCSKNDEANALEPFERHPEMVLRRDDIACFVANWTDKAANLRHIATAWSLPTITPPNGPSCARNCRWSQYRNCRTIRRSTPPALPTPGISRRGTSRRKIWRARDNTGTISVAKRLPRPPPTSRAICAACKCGWSGAASTS
jgi:hypothetical protein